MPPPTGISRQTANNHWRGSIGYSEGLEKTPSRLPRGEQPIFRAMVLHRACYLPAGGSGIRLPRNLALPPQFTLWSIKRAAFYADLVAAPAPCRSAPLSQARVRRSRTECRRVGSPKSTRSLLEAGPEARGRRVATFWGLTKCLPGSGGGIRVGAFLKGWG